MAAQPAPQAPPPAPPASAGFSTAAIVGGLLVLLSVFLPWFGNTEEPLGFGDSTPAFHERLPLLSLFDFGGEGVEESFLSIGLVLLALAILTLLLSFSEGARPFRILCGLLIVAIAVLFAIRVIQFVIEAEEPGAFFNVMGLGAWVALVGAVLILAGRGRAPV
jgi:hypothetical protein